MSFTLWVPGRLPGLNELLREKANIHGRWNGYNEIKCQWYGQIQLLARAKQVDRQGPGFATFLFVEPNAKRDPDNIVSGGVKLLFDSLVGAGVLLGDGWTHVLGYVGYWVKNDNRAGCLVHWSPDELASKSDMLSWLEKEAKNANETNGPSSRNSQHGTDRKNHGRPPGRRAFAGR